MQRWEKETQCDRVWLHLSRDRGGISVRSLSAKHQDLSGDPNPQYFLKSTAVQMGGVVPYKWEVYCSANGRCTVGFPILQGLEARTVQRYTWGAYCRTNWRCIAVLFSRPVGVGVSETPLKTALVLGGRFGFFLCSGEGRGSPRRQEGVGVGFLFKVPRERGSPRRGGKGAGGCLRGIWVHFCGGPTFPPRQSECDLNLRFKSQIGSH